MNTRMAVRGIAGIALLVAFSGSARAQSVAGIGAGGLGGMWFGAGQSHQEPGFLSLNGGLAYLNNAALSATDKQSDELATAGIDVNYQRTGSQLNVSAFGNLDWLEYVQHSFSPQPYGNLFTNATWGAPTSFFQWNLQDTFGEGQENPLGVPTLANQEYINYLSTGPRLNFNFSRRTQLNVHARYQSTTYQTSPFTSWSYDGGAGITEGLSPISSVSLEADALRTRFGQDGIAPTYDTRTASVTYSAKFPRTSLSASAGYTDINYTNSWTGAPTATVNLTRQLGPSSSIFVSGQTGYYTLGQAMTSNLGAPAGASVVAGMVPYTSSPAPFKESFGSVGWSFNRLRTSLALAASVGSERYAQTPILPGSPNPTIAAALYPSATLDITPDASRQIRPVDLSTLDQSTQINSTFETYSASITRKLQPTLSLGLRGYLTDSRYGQLGGSSVYESYSLVLTKQFGRASVSAYSEWLHQSTSGVSTGLALANYDAAVVGLTATYSLIGPIR